VNPAAFFGGRDPLPPMAAWFGFGELASAFAHNAEGHETRVLF
jgi:hypothetical protein